MAIREGHATSRDAKTLYEVDTRFRGFSTIRITPKTGRTHQIRVHMHHAGHPVLCDKLYGGRSAITAGELTGDRTQENVVLDRQALHACRLTVKHPTTGAPISFEAPLPDDIQAAVELLRRSQNA